MNTQQEEDIIDLRELFAELWRRRWRIALFPVAFGLAMLIYVLSVDNIYRATVVLAPADSEAGRGLAGLASQFGGLASLAGISIGSGESGTVNALAIMRSESFVRKFIKDVDGKKQIYPDQWDAQNNEWLPPGSLDSALASIKSVMTGNAKKSERYADPNEPTDTSIYEEFTSDYFKVSEDKKTGLITVSMETRDPELSVRWASRIVEMLNSTMRIEAMNQAEKSVAFLENELKNTQIVEMQKSINQLIEAQIKTKMMANVSEEYAFKTLAPAVVPEKQVFPKRFIMLIGSVFLGFVFGVGVFVLMFMIKGASAVAPIPKREESKETFV